MYTFKYKPEKFKDIIGHRSTISYLRKVIKSPDNSLKSFILSGPYGIGKSSIAYVFSEELKRAGNLVYYKEYSSFHYRNKSFIDDFISSFNYSNLGGYRVSVFNEAHLLKSSQGAFLDLIERNLPGNFFIFTTTDETKIIDTLKDRSVLFHSSLISDDNIAKLLLKIIKNESLIVENDIINKIVKRAGGHVRTAIMLLEKYFYFQEEFMVDIETSDDIFNEYFNGSTSASDSIFQKLCNFPLARLKEDIERFVLREIEKSDDREGLFKGNTVIALNFFSYYVNNKMSAFENYNDFFSLLFLLHKLIPRENNKKKKIDISKFSKKGA